MSNQEKQPSQPQDAPEKQPSSAVPAESVSPPPAPVHVPQASESKDGDTEQAELGRQTLFVKSPKLSAGQPCPKCGHVNRAGVLVCENCGTLLVGEDRAVSTKRFKSEEPEPSADQRRNMSMETAELVNMAVSTAGSSLFSENMVLRLEIDGAPTPLLVTPKAETTIGRRDPATGTMPDVDLSAYAGYRLGVSRKHAIIRLKNKQLEIYDLGSSNGTSVNGVRLAAHQPHPLRDGDEILLGKMVVQVLFQVKNRRK